MLNLILVLFGILGIVKCQIDLVKYYKLPPVDKLEDYDKCMAVHGDEATFCMVHVQIKPDNTSELWNYIDEISNHPKQHYFRHNRLRWYICLSDCKISETEMQVQRNELDEHLQDDAYPPHKFPLGLFLNEPLYHRKYGQLINICINQRLRAEYNFTAFTEPAYCTSPNDGQRELDTLDKSFLIVLYILIFAIVASTAYDIHIKHKSNAKLHHHYTTKPASFVPKVLIAFSFYRNWKKLVSPRARNDHKTLHSLKVFLSIIIIAGHTMMLRASLPSANAVYVEQKSMELLSNVVTTGSVATMTFFTFTGFILGTGYFQMMEKTPKVMWLKLIAFVGMRYLRTIPVYGFLIFFSATWLTRIGDGPLWKHTTESEYTSCRTNGWTNFLFINNYVNYEVPCMQQAWFLAADYQLTIYAIVLFAIIWKFPKSVLYVLGAAYSFALVGLAVVVYAKSYDITFFFWPEYFKHILVDSPMYADLHISTHLNSGNYILGILLAYFYHRLMKAHVDLAKNKIFKAIWLWQLPILIGMLFSGSIYRFYDFEKPSIWIAIHATLLKHLWGLAVGVLILGFKFNLGGITRHTLNNRLFLVWGRLTFAIYLVHPIVLRITEGLVRTLKYGNLFLSAVEVSQVIVLSFFISFFLVLMVEMPFATLVNLLFRKEEKQLTTRADESNSKNVDLSDEDSSPNGNNKLKHNVTLQIGIK